MKNLTFMPMMSTSMYRRTHMDEVLARRAAAKKRKAYKKIDSVVNWLFVIDLIAFLILFVAMRNRTMCLLAASISGMILFAFKGIITKIRGKDGFWLFMLGSFECLLGLIALVRLAVIWG